MLSCRCLFLALLVLATSAARSARAYIEAPMTLGAIVKSSTTVVLLRVEKVDKDRKLIWFRKAQELKGSHPDDAVKHMIGDGRNGREPKFILDWAAPGQTAVWFSNGTASVTCVGSYWYDGYPLGNWWYMQTGEPFQRSYCGPAERLAEAVKDLVAGKEVVVPAMADCAKDDIHLRKGPIQQMKVSLQLLDYNPKRDVVPEAKR